MSRGLTGGEITALQAREVIVEEHVKIQTRTPTIIGTSVSYTVNSTYRYTTGQVETVVGGDGTYVPQSYINTLEWAAETYEITPSQVTITFQTFDQSLITALDTVNAFSHLVEIYKVLLNASTRSITGRFLAFSGHITGIDILGSRETQVLSVRCANNFDQFVRNSGRTIADLDQSRVYEPILWGSIQV